MHIFKKISNKMMLTVVTPITMRQKLRQNNSEY